VPAHFNLTYQDRDLAKFGKLQGRWDLADATNQLPALVTFSDRADYQTAKLHNYRSGSEVMPGIVIKRITIEMTNDPVTRAIKRYLPWLAQFSRLNDEQKVLADAESRLSGDMFTRGEIRDEP
jgi:hypothetical protein